MIHDAHTYASGDPECWADNVRGQLGCLQLVCSIPVVREALGDEDLLHQAFELQDDEAIGWLADEIEGLQVDCDGKTYVLEWRDGDIMAQAYAVADGLCCNDCAVMMANGELPHDMDEDSDEAQAIIAGTAGCCLGFDQHNDDAGFHWSPCECCGSRLGGDRHYFHFID